MNCNANVFGDRGLGLKVLEIEKGTHRLRTTVLECSGFQPKVYSLFYWKLSASATAGFCCEMGF